MSTYRLPIRIKRKAVRLGFRYTVKSVAGLIFLKRIKKSWKMTPDQVWNHQTRRLLSIYEYARKHVPYYIQNRNLYTDINDLSIKIPFEILSALPVLKKDTVRESNYLFLLNKKALFINTNTTSGTSGTPLKLNVSLLEGSFSHAIMQVWHKRISGYRNPKTLYLTGFMTP